MLENKVDFYDTSIIPNIIETTSKRNNDYDEFMKLLKELVDSKNGSSNKSEIIDSIDKIVRGKSEKWTYE